MSIIERLRNAVAIVLLRIAIRIAKHGFIHWTSMPWKLSGEAWDWDHDVDPQYQLEVARETLEKIHYDLSNLGEFNRVVLHTYQRHERNWFKNVASIFSGLFQDVNYIESSESAFYRKWTKKK